jgi:hypothetical protein
MPNKSPSVRAELVEALWFWGVRFDRPVLSKVEGLNVAGLIRYFLR